ncbi:type IV secretion protein Rhs [Serratia rubidaea]|uniref:Type IV secretion protein Rhs n=1 Tax=Serratia rubidaea TaxID=61652 RepID=A0ABS0MC53_SERRU|nr:type IV secretion protein Rhs [Serratia rubidaea]MBH1929847.1 type IV secretion protein Rhs [Serratia rubidaea]MDC6120850.1 type IV secretion protein Rhs [Serratia rubidaea]MEB7586975.1 type IV secretion protein Rhs [Serratia rubidaea]
MENGHVNKEGSLRRLTLGEIAMARRVFGDSIVYSRVWVHCESYLPFGLQNKNVAMAPNGELWLRKELYRHDFSVNTVIIDDKHLFIHELGHVWQHQHGQWVRMRGLFSWAAEYHYRLDRKKLTDYPLEQQASILADYWLLLVYGIDRWRYYQKTKPIVKYRGTDHLREIPSLYKKIVTGKG